MKSFDRTLRIVPAGQRERRKQEWLADLHGATELDLDPADLHRGFRKTAWQLRRRHVTHGLTGKRGAAPMMIGWGTPLTIALLVTPYLIPLLGAVAMVTLAIKAPRCRRALAALATLWSGTLIYATAAWWVGFDYADANLAPPGWTQAWLPAFGVSVVTALAFAVTALTSTARPNRHTPSA